MAYGQSASSCCPLRIRQCRSFIPYRRSTHLVHDDIRKQQEFIGGFHVTSDEANFASHRTRDRHVGFHSP